LKGSSAELRSGANCDATFAGISRPACSARGTAQGTMRTLEATRLRDDGEPPQHFAGRSSGLAGSNAATTGQSDGVELRCEGSGQTLTTKTPYCPSQMQPSPGSATGRAQRRWSPSREHAPPASLPPPCNRKRDPCYLPRARNNQISLWSKSFVRLPQPVSRLPVVVQSFKPAVRCMQLTSVLCQRRQSIHWRPT